MKITAHDIHHKEFKRGIRGYSEEEVDLFLDQLCEQFEQLYKQNHNYEEEIQQLKEKLKTYQNMELTLQNTLLTAQKSAEEVQMNAKKEADVVVNNARAEVKRTLSKAEKQKQILSETFAKLRSLETDFKGKMRSNLESLLDRLNRIDAEEESILDEIEKKFSSVPEIEIPKVTAEGGHPEEAGGRREDLTKKSKSEETGGVDDVGRVPPPAGRHGRTRQSEEDLASKADASKSDIASEEEIDKFLQQEPAMVENAQTDEKQGLLGRIFKRKEELDQAKEQDNGNRGKQSSEPSKPEKTPKKKPKAKKAKKKNTEEIKV